MRLIWHFAAIVLALVAGFVLVLLSPESPVANQRDSKGLQAEAELLSQERKRVDALAQALAAAKLELAASQEQMLALQQERQRAVSLTAKLAQELATVRRELEAAKE